MRTARRFVAWSAAMMALALSVSGCTPGAVRASLPAGSKVTIINALDPVIANSHLGVTAFSTYAEPLVNDWGVPQEAARELAETLHEEGLEALVLSVEGEDRERLSNQLKLDRALNPRASGVDGDFRRWLLSVKHQTAASSLIVLRGFSKPVFQGSTFHYASYGILSSWGFKPEQAELFANVTALVLNGDGLVPAPAMTWREGDCHRQISTAGLAVDNLKHLTAADLAPFRDDLTRMVVTRLRQDVITAGLSRATLPVCAF